MDHSSENSTERKQYVAPTLTELGVTQGTRSGQQPSFCEAGGCTFLYFTTSNPT